MSVDPKTMASDQAKPKQLNPLAKPFINKWLPHHFFNQRVPPPPAVAPVVFPPPPQLIHYPLFYYPPLCKYSLQFQPQSINQLPKAQSQSVSIYRSGVRSGFAACGGGGERVVKKVVREKVSGGFGFKWRFRNRLSCRERTNNAQLWREKRSPGSDSVCRSSPPPPPSPPSPLSSASEELSSFGKTSLMIKNVPNKFRRNTLMDFLDALCAKQNQIYNSESDTLSVAYDFLYLPMDFKTGDNLGYAFVNFTNDEAALTMKKVLNRYKWGDFKDSFGSTFDSKKITEITWARIQGKEDLVKRFKNSKFVCGNVEYLPVTLSPARDGSTSFTAPTTIGNCLLSAP